MGQQITATIAANTMWRRLFAWPLLLAALAGQQATFRSGIELVQIDVVVLDEQGRHVRGLTAADFALRDRGKPQEIAAFQEFTHARPAAAAAPINPTEPIPLDVASNSTAQTGRLVVMVIDDLHIWQGRTEAAKSIARDFLSRLGDEASMAVLFTSGQKSTQVSTDRSVLTTAIDTLRGRQSVRRPNQAVDRQRSRPIDPEASMESALAIVAEAQSTSLQQFADNMSLLTTLRDAAAMMGIGDARRKAFVLISEGFAKNPTGIFGTMSEPGDAPEGGLAYAGGDIAATMTVKPAGFHDGALIRMMDAMRRANVSTYAIDPRGEVTSQELALESFPDPVAGDSVFRWNSPVRIAQDGLTTIAEASGGFAVTNTDDFSSRIGDIVEDLDHYYVLGFYPANTRKDEFHKVSLTVPGHPGWKVRYRHGYVPGDPEEKSKAKEADALTALSAGVLPNTGLRLRLHAVPIARGDKDSDVAIALEVAAPRVAITDPDGRLRDEVSYEVLVVDDKRKRVRSGGRTRARVTLSPARQGGELPDTATYQIADSVTLSPGTYQLRVGVHSEKLATGGSVYLPLTVPDFSKDAIAVSGIAIGYADGSRVASASSAASPLLPFAPTLDRVFAPQDVLRVYAKTRSGSGAITGHVEVLSTPGMTVGSTLPFTVDPTGRVDLTLPLTNLSPGGYVLRLTARAGSDTASRSVVFRIR